MNAIVGIFALVLVLAVAALTVLVIIIAGIHAEGRRMSPSDAPHTRS